MKQIKDRLAALVPYYDREGNNATLLYTTDGEVIPDRRTVKWNLRRLARLYGVDLQAIRQNYGQYLGCRQGVPLPFTADLVLVPLKTRTPVGKNDGCYGYVNGPAVENIYADGANRGRCVLALAGGHKLHSFYSCRTVRNKIRLSKIALDYYRQNQSLRQPSAPGSLLPVLLSPAWWELVETFIKIMAREATDPSSPED